MWIRPSGRLARPTAVTVSAQGEAEPGQRRPRRAAGPSAAARRGFGACRRHAVPEPPTGAGPRRPARTPGPAIRPTTSGGREPRPRRGSKVAAGVTLANGQAGRRPGRARSSGRGRPRPAGRGRSRRAGGRPAHASQPADERDRAGGHRRRHERHDQRGWPAARRWPAGRTTAARSAASRPRPPARSPGSRPASAGRPPAADHAGRVGP